MKQLIEFCKAIPPGKLRYTNLIGKANDKVDELFRLIQQEKITNKGQALEHMFPDGKYPAQAFWNLEQKLYDRLTNTIISLHDTEESEILSEFRTLQKKLYAYKLLRAKGRRHAAVVLGEKAIKKSIHYEFTEITLSLARELAMHYASIDPDKKKFQYFNDLATQNGTLLMKEMEVEQCFNEVVFQFASQKFYDEDLIELAKKRVGEVNAILVEHQSFWTILLGYNTIVYYHNLIKDNEGLLEACQKAIALMEAKAYNPPYTAVFTFVLNTLPIYILNGQYSAAQQAIKKCLALVPVDSHNWMITQQYQVLLNFHQEEYQANLQLIRKIKNRHSKSIRNHSEIWRIYEAYASFMTGQPIRLGKFLNELPVFSKDKRGMNINILILQILFFLKDGQYGKILDRMDALERYTYRYLKKDKSKTFRSNCFLFMLLAFGKVKGDFRRPVLERKARIHLERLQSLPLAQSGQDFELEIIPYERLWNVILGMVGSE